MSKPEIQALADLATFTSGGTPSKQRDDFYNGSIPWITGADIDAGGNYRARTRITPQAVRETSAPQLEADSLLLVTRTSVGKAAVTTGPVSFSQDITGINPDPSRVDPQFLRQYLSYRADYFKRNARGATIKGVTREIVANLPVPLPSLPSQRRIATILDLADSARVNGQSQASLASVQLRSSLFLSMFGDPGANSRNWPLHPLGDLAVRFSDGPFGSHLKSSHYAADGVRVIRLQNIGTGEFLDRDRAFIDEDHFQALSRHECLPGDVLIGTMGDPNLRACVQPKAIPRAINKADCVQMRVDERLASPVYVCGMLNQPGLLARARALITGQTRSRISMGRLRELQVPLPPLDLQARYAERLALLGRARAQMLRRNEAMTQMLASIQAGAFEGDV